MIVIRIEGHACGVPVSFECSFDGEEYQCPKCDRRFATESTLVAHYVEPHAMTQQPTTYDAGEQDVVLRQFTRMLRSVTKDGGRKRAAGTKPPWWRDTAHEAAIFSHLNKWKHGEKFDPDSGVHPLVHLAWRALAIAYQETHGQTDPATRPDLQLLEPTPFVKPSLLDPV